ncbi:MAG TPA: trypsin-like peptidase domain-containing protein [Planctomycetota bacterium]|nr:trypsin-like peptidase domain-containing protein [Planctomycetota bacterium]
MKSAIVRLVLPALLGFGSVASGAEPEAPVTLPDVRAIVRQRQNAVVRVETFESYLPGLVRRSVRLANPFPLSSNVSDAFSFAFYLPSAIFYGLRKHLGSGVLIDAEGHVLTNYHVIKGADRIAVRLVDADGARRRLDATVVGTDRHVDIALLKVDPGKVRLVTAPLGDSDQVALGDWVIAIGNPHYLTGTITCGVVSGLHRQVRQNLLEDFIQVDAAVNPGNSGGPILNTRGEVIGLVDLGMFPANNIGFAIPTNLITPFLDDMKKHGRPRRGYLGIGVRDLTPELAKEGGLGVETGVVVAEVSAFSPAGRAGIEKGDLVESVGGKKAATARDVQMAVLRTPPGVELPITVRRGDKALDLKPKLALRRAPFRIF